MNYVALLLICDTVIFCGSILSFTCRFNVMAAEEIILIRMFLLPGAMTTVLFFVVFSVIADVIVTTFWSIGQN